MGSDTTNWNGLASHTGFQQLNDGTAVTWYAVAKKTDYQASRSPTEIFVKLQ